MPTLNVVVGTDGLAIDAPVFGWVDDGFNPLGSDVLYKVVEGLFGCQRGKDFEHWHYLLVGEERKG